MRIRMKVGVSGTHSGEDWPPLGGTLLVDDEYGAQLCAGGMAEPVYEPEPVETAVAPDPEKRNVATDMPEKRGPGRPKKQQP